MDKQVKNLSQRRIGLDRIDAIQELYRRIGEIPPLRSELEKWNDKQILECLKYLTSQFHGHG
jgi:hypothetical protein